MASREFGAFHWASRPATRALIASPFMCGICGIVNFDHRPVSASELVAMTRLIDPTAVRTTADLWTNGHAGLGHRRLAIIDLSQRGNQPMTNEDGTVWVVFNGEIYNFRELRRELRGAATASARSPTPRSSSTATRSGARARRAAQRHVRLWALGRAEGQGQAPDRGDRFGKKPLFFAQTGMTVVSPRTRNRSGRDRARP